MKRSFLTAVSLAILAFSALVHADQRDFNLHNATGEVISELHISPNDSNQWGPDILGRDVLNDGQTAAIHFNGTAAPGQCIWDIKVVDGDGEAHTLENLNLCTVTVVTFATEHGHMVYHLN